MLFYSVVPGATQTTNASANTESDQLFITPGTKRAVFVTGIYPVGRGASLTSISGISYRLKKWTTTASSAGTAITPTPKESGYAAAQATAGFSASAVTSGTGGPTLILSIGSGTTSPGNFMSRNQDEAPRLYGADTQSMDIFSISGAVSLVYEISLETSE